MNWDNGLLDTVYVLAIRIIPNRSPWLLLCLVVFLVARPVVEGFAQTSRGNLLGLMKTLKRLMFLLSLCTCVFFVALYAVAVTGTYTDSVELLAMFLRLWDYTWLPLCTICVVALSLLLVWAVYKTRGLFARPAFGWVHRKDKHKDDAKTESEGQKE
ncbi:MAG: hypothetical protein ACYSUD_09350 [Planctomycetota bacterium]|jgi:hypothetical protein